MSSIMTIYRVYQNDRLPLCSIIYKRCRKKTLVFNKPYLNGDLTKKNQGLKIFFRNLFKHLCKISLDKIFGFSPRISDLSIWWYFERKLYLVPEKIFNWPSNWYAYTSWELKYRVLIKYSIFWNFALFMGLQS